MPFLLILTLMLLLAACGGGEEPTPTATATRAPATATATAVATPVTGEVLLIALSEKSASGQSGTATLTAMGDKTEVVISVTPGAVGVAQPIHIHSGTCATLGDVVHVLTDVAAGKSTSTVNATLASLRTGDFAINLHKSGADIGTYTACGDIPIATASLTISLNEKSASGQSGNATLTAKGDKTEVVISVTPGAVGVAQPVHIHSGTCATLGDVVHVLTDVVAGKSTSTVNATLASLRTGNFAINLHKSGADIGTYTACGDIPIATASLTISLNEKSASGQSGNATLTAKGDKTEVVISVTPGAVGVAQPVHIHSGTCATLGDVVHVLTDVVAGKSTSTVNATLASLRTGNFAINLHKSGADIGTYTACGDIPVQTASGASTSSNPTLTTGKQVSITARQLSTFTVAAGTKVGWTNQSTETHTVTGSAGKWQSGSLAPGTSFSYTFTAPGTFNYYCEYHAEMSGTVTVTEATSGSGDYYY